ncbi:hypothetical protein CPter291_0551 [Collimonas pratensis]|uniref:Uncharacterized protein n=1 Tax=Collimonas pratensis TaxID=279113 RepID=A0ABN4M400_9BURK|nr:hypothetical protein CPter291_0551 [Collimonas pratensis]
MVFHRKHNEPDDKSGFFMDTQYVHMSKYSVVSISVTHAGQWHQV